MRAVRAPEFLYLGTARRFGRLHPEEGFAAQATSACAPELDARTGPSGGQAARFEACDPHCKGGGSVPGGARLFLSGDVFLVEVMPPQFMVTPDPDEA